MTTSTVTAGFASDIERVWEFVTDNANTAWRSDLERVKCAPDGLSFTEYAKGGFPTACRITEKKRCERYAFTMENRNLAGRWLGEFFVDGAGCRIRFTEELEVKNPLMRLFVRSYLKKQQARYVADLKRALGE